MNYWISVLGVSVGTFIIRYAFLGSLVKSELPPFIKKSLTYVPVSIMAALVGVGFFTKDGSIVFDSITLISLAAAALLALKWRNDLVIISAGLGSYWLALYFLK